MKFTVHQGPLFKALQSAQSVVEKKNTVQILSNFLCHVKNGVLSLSATDLEVGIKLNLPVEKSEDGKVTLSAKHFFEIVKELPDQPVVVSKKDNNWVEIICGKSKFNVVSLSPDEFPALSAFEEKMYSESRPEALKEMIDRTLFAISQDATRYNMNGVFFESIDQGVFRMTATDGHRLSFVDSEVFKKAFEFKRGVILPKKGVMELRRFLDESDGEVDLCFERGVVYAKTQSAFLSIRLIEGEFPDYRQVLPKDAKSSMTVDREGFTSAFKRVSLLAHEKSRAVKLSLQRNQLTITSSNPDMGEAQEEIEVSYDGEPLEIGFNSKYVLECLTALGSAKIEFRFKDKLSPGILQGCDERNHTYVIMPMRI